MKEREKAVQQAMTVGFAIRIIEATGSQYLQSVVSRQETKNAVTPADMGRSIADYAWITAQELMAHYPDVPSEQPQAIDFPMISPVRPS